MTRFIFFFFLILPLISGAQPPLTQIEEKIAAELMTSFAPLIEKDADKVEGWMADSLQGEGKWRDLDYDTQSGVDWGPTVHLGRVRVLAVFYQTAGQRFYQDPKVLETIKRSIDYFVARNFQSYNWWLNEIGVPLNIGQTLILLRKPFQEERKKWGKYFMTRGVRGGTVTGQNRGWLAQVQLYRSVILNDLLHLEEAAKNIRLLLVYSENPGYFNAKGDEGIFPDFTFIQHFWIFYNLGYGLYFSDTVSRFLNYLRGTTYEFPAAQVELFLDFVANGQVALARNGSLDYSALGRNHVRLDAQNASLLADICERLSVIESVHQSLFRYCALGVRQKNFSQTLNRYFWNGDYMIHQRPNFSISVKTHSKRLKNGDLPSNGEGLRSEHLADGATYIYRTGNEYKDIFPAWNYRQVPGTTAVPKNWTEATPLDDFNYFRLFTWSYNPVDFVGGVSDGNKGISTMIYEKNGISEKKTYFFNDFGMVVLGTDLVCTGQCSGISSSINQTWLDGPVVVGVADEDKDFILPRDYQSQLVAKWVHHAETGYLFLDPTSVSLSNSVQWGDIAKISAQAPYFFKTGEVFNLSVPRVDKSATSYGYAIYPEISVSNLKLQSLNPGFEVLANNSATQAILTGTMIQASFFAPGDLKIPRGGIRRIFATNPMAIQVTESIDRTSIYVSDPTHLLKKTTFFMTNEYGVDGKFEVEFSQGANAGRAKVIVLQKETVGPIESESKP